MGIETNVRLFCSDLDGTLLGEPEATADFIEAWNAIEGERPILVYSTGRLDGDAKRMIKLHGMPEPDFYTTGVGTMIFSVKDGAMLDEFSESLNKSWDLEKVREIVAGLVDIEEQPPEQQHDWKSSWFWRGRTNSEIDSLRKELQKAGLAAQVIYSTSRDLDILPVAANKGNAITWLTNYLGVNLQETVVAGDSGNDSSMFLLEGVKGIAPANAEPELLEALDGMPVFRAKRTSARGVIDGLRHYGVFS
ncbi:HAD-IIB family hydrolase [Luteolibacter algae]|uniref:HAD-IIB family hydrolase n=1 Tax=Luteolibacter algae TaxID=454151 RepID=A0ABW5D9R8_9BACT